MELGDLKPSAKRNALVIESVGTLFIITLGSAFHFTYELSGNNPIVGSFSAINESVWEHLKLAFWPALIWMLIVWYPLKNSVNNFFPSKAIGVYIMVLFIPAIFYLHTAITGESIFLIDLDSFIAAVVIGQMVSYKLYRYKLPKKSKIGAIIAMALLAIAFVIFTFYPPQLPIFQDPVTMQHGIV
jgi:hypothetical protein